jgi:hypothetical protein
MKKRGKLPMKSTAIAIIMPGMDMAKGMPKSPKKPGKPGKKGC